MQAKMQEYPANGLLLGWLIDPETEQVEIYRPNQEVKILDNLTTLSGKTVLPSFVLNLLSVFED